MGESCGRSIVPRHAWLYGAYKRTTHTHTIPTHTSPIMQAYTCRAHKATHLELVDQHVLEAALVLPQDLGVGEQEVEGHLFVWCVGLVVGMWVDGEERA